MDILYCTVYNVQCTMYTVKYTGEYTVYTRPYNKSYSFSLYSTCLDLIRWSPCDSRVTGLKLYFTYKYIYIYIYIYIIEGYPRTLYGYIIVQFKYLYCLPAICIPVYLEV